MIELDVDCPKCHYAIHLDERTGTFYCDQCGFSGDLFTFVMQRDRCDFRQALTTICDMLGVDNAE